MLAVLLSILLGLVTASPAPDTLRSVDPLTKYIPSDKCGDVAQQYLDPRFAPGWISASDAVECLISVPFNSAVAARFVAYFNQTLQFQSTLAYLRNSPESYKRPAVDVVKPLDYISGKVAGASYTNQYAFEVDIRQLIRDMHDAHVTFAAGILSQFTFGSALGLATVSIDGKQIPKVYAYADLLGCSNQTGCRLQEVAPIRSINSIPVVEYLSAFAKDQSFGLLEEHADWNNLMTSQALELQEKYGIFSMGATFYPGDTLTVEFEGSSDQISLDWRATYNAPNYVGPLANGGDFYNYFVLGLTPESYNASWFYQTYPRQFDQPRNRSSYLSGIPAYPATSIANNSAMEQQGSLVLSGYYIKDIDTAVLTLPTFSADVQNFFITVKNFIERG